MPGSSEASECSVTDMQKGKSYRYRVCAQNRQGKGHYVEFAKLILAEDPPTVPNPPRNLTYSNIKKESVNLGWSIPKYDGGSDITGRQSGGSDITGRQSGGSDITGRQSRQI